MISDYMDKINDLAHVEAEIIFSTEIIDNKAQDINFLFINFYLNCLNKNYKHL